MSDAYIGEIRVFTGNFAPYGWAFCNGQLLPISQNTALFSILGTQYGGDGRTTFALPNLQGSAPMHQGTGAGLTPRTVGETVGTETVTLLLSEIPAHTHTAQAVANPGNATTPANNFWAEGAKDHHGQASFYDPTASLQMAPNALSIAGGSQPHNNMQPFLALNFIICLQGIFPARS